MSGSTTPTDADVKVRESIYEYWNEHTLGLSHFYRKPSWMYSLKQIRGVNIEFEEEDPPVNDFLAQQECEAFFSGFDIVETTQEHHRLLPVCRSGVKATLYNYGLKPVYNLLPDRLARRYAYKYSITAVKK